MAASTASILKPFVFGIMVVGLPLSYLAYFAHVHFTDDPKSIWYHSTYSDYLKALDFQPIDQETNEEDVGYVMLGKLYPHHKSDQKKLANSLFVGSPEFTLKNTPVELTVTNKNKKRKSTFLRNEAEDAKKLKIACITALSQNPYGNQKRADQLKEWCTVPTVAQILTRHKFKLISSKDDWSKILESDWFKPTSNDSQFKHENDQSFFEDSEKQKLFKKEGDRDEKLEIIENRCRIELAKPIVRNVFPLTKKFLNSLTEPRQFTFTEADKFQEAALFCTQPITAEYYVSEVMQSVVKTELDAKYSKNIDYCYVQGKDSIEEYKKIKTTDPMDGKTFWCAVRLIYDRNKITTPKLKTKTSVNVVMNGPSTNGETVTQISTNEIQS